MRLAPGEATDGVARRVDTYLHQITHRGRDPFAPLTIGFAEGDSHQATSWTQADPTQFLEVAHQPDFVDHYAHRITPFPVSNCFCSVPPV